MPRTSCPALRSVRAAINGARRGRDLQPEHFTVLDEQRVAYSLVMHGKSPHRANTKEVISSAVTLGQGKRDSPVAPWRTRARSPIGAARSPNLKSPSADL